MALPPWRHHSEDRPTASGRRTILVVEDDVDLRAALRFALEDYGFVVESAGDGLSALQKVRQLAPDLVILDLNMPRMGGEDFLYAWRTGLETVGVPVVVITAESRALRSGDLGVAACFIKPFDLHDLLSRVQDLVAVPSQARAAAGRDPRGEEMAEVSDDLVDVVSTLLIGIEQVAAASDLPDDLRLLMTSSLDAAHRAAVLTRRLNRLVNTLK